jgi:hypothetical protein
MSIFLCRWPNGSFSIVNASSKADAVELLDEFGNTDGGAAITRMPECLADFKLNDKGEFELERFSEAANEFIMETCYPELDLVLTDADRDDEGYTATGMEQIHTAVKHERNRLYNRTPSRKKADTEAGRTLQSNRDLPRVVANRIVRRAAKEILRSKKGDGGPVQ